MFDHNSFNHYLNVRDPSDVSSFDPDAPIVGPDYDFCAIMEALGCPYVQLEMSINLPYSEQGMTSDGVLRAAD